MKDGKDELKERFSELPMLSFSDELRERILKQASGEHVAPKRNRIQTKNWLAGLSGLVAACLIIGVLFVDNAGHKAQTPITATTQPQLSSGDYGLVKAPLVAVSYQVLPPKIQGGSAILEATLKNNGPEALSKEDVFAVVSFNGLTSPTSPVAQLVAGKFLAIANGPTFSVPPGGTATWDFGTFGIPFVHNDPSSLQPEVNFYYSKLSSSKYSVAWHHVAGISISGVTQTPRVPIGPTGYSVIVNATLQNTTSKPMRLDQLAAIIYYGQNWTDWRNVRTLNSIRVTGQSVIASGQSLPVSFRLIGPNVPLFVNGHPFITIVWKSSLQG